MIRTARPGEELVLLDLERAASTAGLGHIFGNLPFPADDVLARWHLLLREQRVHVALAEHGGEPVGYVAYDDTWLRHLGVLPDWWGRGVGRRLHDLAIDAQAGRGAPTTYLWVLEDNHRARAFYRRLGWRDTVIQEEEVFAPYPVKRQMSRRLDSSASPHPRGAG
jgi:GNAT superfamily N-acetyltransferase